MVVGVVSVVERFIVFDFVIRFPPSSDSLGVEDWRRLISDVAGLLGILVYRIVSRFGGACGMLQV